MAFTLTVGLFFLAKCFACLVAVLLLRVGLWAFKMVVFDARSDPLRRLPGPSAGFFEPHFSLVLDPDLSIDTYRTWSRDYGKTFRFHGFGKHDLRLMSFDPRVVSHILNSPLYEKPWQTRALLGKFLGQGVVTKEGEDHRRQRKILRPAFSGHTLKLLTPTFFRKAYELRRQWDEILDSRDGVQQSHAIDAFNWFSRATFDAFGLAVFGCQFFSITDESSPVAVAVRRMFDAVEKRGVLYILVPALETFWPDEAGRITRQCLAVIREWGRELLNSRINLVRMEKASVLPSDLLDVLIQSNASSPSHEQLSQSDLLDEVTSLLFAGSDSTAVALSWCFHQLAQNPHIQKRLGDEIITAHSKDAFDSGFEDESSDAASESSSYSTHLFQTLPLLDGVVKETLRICSPVHDTIRVATRDDEIPISHAIQLEDGTTLNPGDTISIRKGSFIHVAINGLNHDEDIWDANDLLEFKPDRWTSSPGLNKLMTFSAGPHACPGHRIAMAEMKAFIVTLLPHFVFRPAEDKPIARATGVLMRPIVSGQWKLGPQLPMSITRYQENVL